MPLLAPWALTLLLAQHGDPALLRPIELKIARGSTVGSFEIAALSGPIELTIEDRGGLPSDEKLPKPKKDEPTPTRPRFQPPPNTPEHELLVRFSHAPIRVEPVSRPALPPWLQGKSDPPGAPAQEAYRYPLTALPPERAWLFTPGDQTILLLLGPDNVFLTAYRFSSASGRFHPTELSEDEKATLPAGGETKPVDRAG
ncbi:MAG TPA: hypothetical protein VGB99_02055 [Acidobacteriota bacterium]